METTKQKPDLFIDDDDDNVETKNDKHFVKKI